MKIQVTADDIKNGKRKLPGDCPVALAITRSMGVRTMVGIRGFWDTTYSFSPLIEFNNPAVTGFIIRYDRGDHVEPFEFEI